LAWACDADLALDPARIGKALAASAVGLCLVAGTVRAAQVDVGTELARLAAEHGFSLTGESYVQDAVGRAEGEDPFRRLRLLLEAFDHIILQDANGGIERVIVLGKAMPGNAPPKTVVEVGDAATEAAADDAGPIELPTIRSGSQHSVRVSLEGTDGKRVERVLLVDTGADTVVLPASMIDALGVAEEQLSEREVQTANGNAQARVGALPAIWLGDQRIGDVQVAFLGDDKLGSAGLLGMSVLGRYQMTIDDEQSTLTLTRR
jgi:clan AA aspartic protease (TIGR02281 family)